MAEQTQNGVVKHVKSKGGTMSCLIEWDNPDPPPPTKKKTYIFDDLSQYLTAALSVGEMVEITTDDSAPNAATGIQKPPPGM